ncbi:MAG: alkaline phosphatase [Bacteroidales bacterium]|nr:alkaline phosphatase [Bacteroidales bacterium]
MKRALFLIAASFIMVTSCQHGSENKNIRAKYVFLFIGDGMGLQQVNATQVYIDSVLKNHQNISFIDFPVQTFATTYAANQYITCSAAAGTALSTGSKTSIGTLGLNYNHTDSLFSIAKKIKEKGFKIGLLTTVSIDHATPAAFYAHQGSRGSSYDIAKDLIKSKFDFFASGGLLDPFGKKLKDSVESIYSLGNRNSFVFTTNLAAIDSLKNKHHSVVYSIPNPASESSIKYRIDQDSTDITLADLTKKAIQTLNNSKGFFMMVEGGKIDWACHANDAATMLNEVIDFSNAVSKAVEFYNAHPDETLIIVTADHETGGFSLGNKENKYSIKLSLLKNQKISKEQFQILVKNYFSRVPKPTFKEMLNLAKEKTGLGNENLSLGLTENEIKKLNEAYANSIKPNKDSKIKSTYLSEPNEMFSNTCIDILNRKSAIGWTSTSHTGSPVPVYVLGMGGTQFTGRIDNTDIPKKIEKVIGLQ